jgi:hypothetical protein
MNNELWRPGTRVYHLLFFFFLPTTGFIMAGVGLMGMSSAMVGGGFMRMGCRGRRVPWSSRVASYTKDTVDSPVTTAYELYKTSMGLRLRDGTASIKLKPGQATTQAQYRVSGILELSLIFQDPNMSIIVDLERAIPLLSHCTGNRWARSTGCGLSYIPIDDFVALDERHERKDFTQSLIHQRNTRREIAIACQWLTRS